MNLPKQNPNSTHNCGLGTHSFYDCVFIITTTYSQPFRVNTVHFDGIIFCKINIVLQSGHRGNTHTASQYAHPMSLPKYENMLVHLKCLRNTPPLPSDLAMGVGELVLDIFCTQSVYLSDVHVRSQRCQPIQVLPCKPGHRLHPVKHILKAIHLSLILVRASPLSTHM